jgi:hypothetical protein
MGEEVIDELLACLDLYNRGEAQQLQQRINEDAYYRNFVNLAQTIEPDGRKVEVVGFTTVRSGVPRNVQLTHTAIHTTTLSLNEAEAKTTKRKGDEETVQVTGTLKMADSTKNTDEIKIISAGNVSHTVVVPSGMMSDIVKPLWDTEVVVTGTQKRRKIYLMQIRPIERD